MLAELHRKKPLEDVGGGDANAGCGRGGQAQGDATFDLLDEFEEFSRRFGRQAGLLLRLSVEHAFDLFEFLRIFRLDLDLDAATDGGLNAAEGAEAGEFAGNHDADLRRACFDFLKMVRGEDDCAFLGDVDDDIPKNSAGGSVDAGAALVEAKEARSADEGHGDGQLAFVATGEGNGDDVAELGQADGLEKTSADLVLAGSVDAANRAVHHQVLVASEEVEERIELGAVADVLASNVRFMCNGVSHDVAVAGSGVVCADDDFHRTRFARTVHTQKSEDGALLDGEAQILDGNDAA